VEIRQLKYFLAAVEHGSISQAARSLFVAQPALTKQIRNLEEELGVTLLERLPRGIALTAAGRQFFRNASKIQDDLISAKQQAIQASTGQLGTMTLGLTVLHSLLPIIAEILRRFRQDAPRVSVTLHQLISGPQVDRIRAGELDAGFLFYRPLDDPTLSGTLISTEKLMLAVPRDSQWATHPPKRLAELNGVDMIWFPRGATPMYYDHLMHHFHKAGYTPHVAMEGSDNAAILTLVTAGMGCAILPALARYQAEDSVVFLPLEDLNLEMPLELVWHTENPSPVLQRFVEIARATFPSR
jgi:DNA-binding transcriptional LysR family regulator